MDTRTKKQKRKIKWKLDGRSEMYGTERMRWIGNSGAKGVDKYTHFMYYFYLVEKNHRTVESPLFKKMVFTQ